MATHLHPSNCIGVRNFAEQHGHCQLVAQADEFIIDNFVAVASSEEFRYMTPENLLTILTSSFLNIRSEVCGFLFEVSCLHLQTNSYVK